MHEPTVRRWSAACVVAILSVPPATHALTRQPQAPQGTVLRFDVVSLKARTGLPPPASGASQIQVTPGRIVVGCTTLRNLMSFAYRLGVSASITGLPTWAHGPCNNLYSSPDTFEFQATMPAETNDVEMRQMMQTFLKDRFKLAVRVEARNMSGYELVVASGGFKLEPTNRAEDRSLRQSPGYMACPPEDGRRGRCQLFALGTTSTSHLAEVLSIHVGRPVVDRTGLTEAYFFALMWALPDQPNSPLPSTVFTAIREKFGLELKPITGSFDVLMVDWVEKPSPN